MDKIESPSTSQSGNLIKRFVKAEIRRSGKQLYTPRSDQSARIPRRRIKRVHFIGIKGVGMTALAIFCKEKGLDVSGSDVKSTFITDKILKEKGIKVLEGYSKTNITKQIDLVIYTGALDITKNIESQAAFAKNIRIISHAEALGLFTKNKLTIAVAGTHGKTTTTAITATVLSKLGLNPSYIVGTSEIYPLKYPGSYREGKYFVVEADEYQTALNTKKESRFLHLDPYIAIITNIELDHPDIFKNITQVKEAFLKFAKRIPKDGTLIYNYDDQNCCEVAKDLKCETITFGQYKKADIYLNSFISFSNHTKSSITLPNGAIKEFTLTIPGIHNILNSLSVIALAWTLKINIDDVLRCLPFYQGSKRRIEKKGEAGSVVYYDDYAHHPTEIKVTLTTLRGLYPKKHIIAVFQPHTYSRTQTLLTEFSQSFKEADEVIVMDIFSSARENSKKYNVSGVMLAETISKHHKQVLYKNSHERVIQYLKRHNLKDSLIVTLGAGDIYKIHEKINKKDGKIYRRT